MKTKNQKFLGILFIGITLLFLAPILSNKVSDPKYDSINEEKELFNQPKTSATVEMIWNVSSAIRSMNSRKRSKKVNAVKITTLIFLPPWF